MIENGTDGQNTPEIKRVQSLETELTGNKNNNIFPINKALNVHSPALNTLKNHILYEPEDLVFKPHWDNEPLNVPPLLTLNGVSVLTAGNISTLVAQTGSGKSHVCESILATTINPKAENLGLIAQLDGGEKVLYVDTERPKLESWRGWARVMRRAGLRRGEPVPQTLEFINLLSLTPLERWEAIEREIETLKPRLIILDGLVDLLPTGDFNSIAESAETIARLVRIANETNAGVLTTIHSNPSDTDLKAKGHAGVKALEKSEFVIGLQKFGDGTRALTTDFRFGKNRSGATSTVYFGWREQDGYGSFVLCDAPERKQGRQNANNYWAIVESIFDDSGVATLAKAKVANEIRTRANVGKQTAYNQIRKLIETGSLTEQGENVGLAQKQ